MYKYVITIFFVLLALSLPKSSNAAVLYFETEQETYVPGSTVKVSLKIDTEGECINVIASEIKFPRGLLAVRGLSTANSILSLWVAEPTFDNAAGVVSFSGGLPGGFCSSRPEAAGTNTILDMYVQPLDKAVSAYRMDIAADSDVLLNDGQGTEAAVTTQSTTLYFEDSDGVATDEWNNTLSGDSTPPEAFVIEIVKDSNIYNGQQVALFVTTDNQSGLSHFEVQEITNKGFTPGTKNKPLWTKVTSPYLIKDQSLQSLIRIKALDFAGNQYIAEYVPEGFVVTDKGKNFTWKILGSGVIIFLLIVLLLALIKKKKDHIIKEI